MNYLENATAQLDVAKGWTAASKQAPTYSSAVTIDLSSGYSGGIYNRQGVLLSGAVHHANLVCLVRLARLISIIIE